MIKDLAIDQLYFIKNNLQKELIEKSIKNIENKFNGKKVVTFIRKFEKFLPSRKLPSRLLSGEFS